MKKICALLVILFLLFTVLPVTALAEGEELPVTLSIDDAHQYAGMDKAYQDGYTPAVNNGKAIIVLPLIASGELSGNALIATPQLGDPSSSPFLFRNYQITVSRQENPVDNGSKTVPSYLVIFELPLASGRMNGVYPVVIDIQAKGADGSDIAKSFTTYITVTDGKNPEGEPSPASQPKVIVADYEIISHAASAGTEQEEALSAVIAGGEFTAKVTLKNTDGKAVQNMTVDVTCDFANLTLLNDSSTLFIGKLGGGKTTEIELRYKTDLETPAQKYHISLSISYEDSKAMSLQSSGIVSVAVTHKMNVKMEKPQIATEVTAGDTMQLLMQVINLGRSRAYNVRIELSAPGLFPLGMAFVGNMEAGTEATGQMDVFIGTLDMSEDKEKKYGMTSGTLTLIYEDSDGREYTDSVDFYTIINEPITSTVGSEPEEPNMASQWWISIAIGAAALGALIILPLVHKKRKARQQ